MSASNLLALRVAVYYSNFNCRDDCRRAFMGLMPGSWNFPPWCAVTVPVQSVDAVASQFCSLARSWSASLNSKWTQLECESLMTQTLRDRANALGTAIGAAGAIPSPPPLMQAPAWVMDAGIMVGFTRRRALHEWQRTDASKLAHSLSMVGSEVSALSPLCKPLQGGAPSADAEAAELRASAALAEGVLTYKSGHTGMRLDST